MSALSAVQHRMAYKLFLRNCLSQEWLSCLVCFRTYQVAVQRLTLSALHTETFMEAEFFIYSASCEFSPEKSPILDNLKLLLEEMPQVKWVLEPLAYTQK